MHIEREVPVTNDAVQVGKKEVDSNERESMEELKQLQEHDISTDFFLRGVSGVIWQPTARGHVGYIYERYITYGRMYVMA